MQCATMNRRTLTMNWDGLREEDDDDQFYESSQRISAVVPLDLASSDSDDGDFEDSRMSFAASSKNAPAVLSASIKNIPIISSASIKNIRSYEPPSDKSTSVMANYDMWMAEPGDITERRKRLLQGMGLSSSKDMLRLASSKITKAVSKKIDNNGHVPTQKAVENNKSSAPYKEAKGDKQQQQQQQQIQTSTPSSSHSKPTAAATAIVLVRSRSDSDIDAISARTKQRKEDLLGSVSKQRLTRTSSGLQIPSIGVGQYSRDVRISPNLVKNKLSSNPSNDVVSDDAFGSFFLIKNLDTGKEFIVKEYNEQGMWNKLSDVQTGKQLTMEEFERSVGYSPVVKELMRRQNRNDGRKLNAKSFTKSFRNSKKKGAAFLKNIKGVATSMSISNKDHEHISFPEEQKEQKAAKVTSQWVKARQHGKTYKEFTALHLSQEIQAHEGSIWIIRFSQDARYLASAGEDKTIHVWEVQECDVMSTRGDDMSSASSTPVHPMAGMGSERPPLTPMLSDMVFALSEKPLCSFNGHQDDVLDLEDMLSTGWIFMKWLPLQAILQMASIEDCKLEHINDVQMKVKSQMKKLPGFQTQPQPKKITGFQYTPWNPSEVLITSTDSRIRIYEGPELIQKYRGFRNTGSQISAFFSPDGKHVISASEDSQVYIWKVDEAKTPAGAKKKTKTTVQSYEHFPCKDVSVAIPWPGSTRSEPPTIDIHSKHHSKRHYTTPSVIPPLEDTSNSNSPVGQSGRKNLPPLPKKNNNAEISGSCADEDIAQSSPIDPGIEVGESVGSSESIRLGDSPSISASATGGGGDGASIRLGESPSMSASATGGGGSGAQTVQATAWGVVIVTASLRSRYCYW